MFASEVYRRGIVVPLSKDSLMNIRNDKVTEGDLVEILRLNDDDLFYRIWKAGVFTELNKICSSLVDDQEQEEVHSNLEQLQKFLHRLEASDHLERDIILFLSSFRTLVEEAISRKMPLLFLF